MSLPSHPTLVSLLGVCPFSILLSKDVKGIAPVEQERSQRGVRLRMPPVFAEDVGWVNVATDVVELNHSRSDRLTRVVVRQGMVSLGQPGVGNAAALHHRLIVAKEV